MNLAELHYLVALDQERHFSRAARLCNVSQPALSSSIRKLEKELEITLFERSRSMIRPTALGQRIISRARKVVAATTAIKDLARAGHDHLESPLAVGAIFDIAPYLLPQCALHLRRTGNPLTLRTHEGDTVELIERLLRGELDVVVVSSPPAMNDIASQAMFDEPYVVLLPRPHPLCAKPRLRQKDLIAHSLILPGEENDFRNHILKAYPELASHFENIKPRNEEKRKNQTLEMLRHLIIAGFGVAVVPLSTAISVGWNHPGLAFRPLANPAPTRKIHLVWRLSFPRHRAIDVLRQTIIACKPVEDLLTNNEESDGNGLLVDNAHW